MKRKKLIICIMRGLYKTLKREFTNPYFDFLTLKSLLVLKMTDIYASHSICFDGSDKGEFVFAN